MKNKHRFLSILLVIVSSVTLVSLTNADQRFPIRLDKNFDIPGAMGDEHYALNYFGTVNDYDFAPDPEGREAFLEKVAKNRAAMAQRAAELKDLGIKNLLYGGQIHYEGSNADLSTLEKKETFIENKFYEIAKLCPWMDGFFMTISESPIPASTPEEVKGYFLAAYQGLDRANQEDGKNRILFAHTYLSNSVLIDNITDFFPITDDPEIAEKIYLVSRHGHGDTNMKTPINPLIGNEGAHPHILIFSLTGGEYKGLDWYPCGMAHEWSERFQELASSPSVVGLQVWGQKSVSEYEEQVGHFKERKQTMYSPWGATVMKWTPWAHLCAYTFHALANDPYKDPNQIYIDWATEHYGEAAAEPLADILAISQDVVIAALPPSHSAYLASRPSYVWSPLEYLLPIDASSESNPLIGEIIYDINATMIDEKQQYFDEAMVNANTMLSILESNELNFAPDDYQRLRDDLVGLKNLLEVKYIVKMGAHRYIYWQNLEGSQRQEQVDIVADLVERGFELQDTPKEFLCQKNDHTHPRYECDIEDETCLGDTTYMPCLRELNAIVTAERKGDILRILPEKVEESFDLPFKSEEIAYIDDNLYILDEENIIHKYSTSGNEIASSQVLSGTITGLDNDGQGNLLLVIDRDIYKLSISNLANATPVWWRSIISYVETPGPLAYDSQTDRLFIGDNDYENSRIVQISPEDEVEGTIAVPYHQVEFYDWIKRIWGLSFHDGHLYSAESYIEPPNIVIRRGLYKLKRYAPATGPNDIVHIDDWQLATRYLMSRGTGQARSICFDGNGDAWFTGISNTVAAAVPLPDTLCRVKLQGGVNYNPTYPQNCQEVYDWGYQFVEDANRDCVINLKDFAVLAESWLMCTDMIENCW